MSKVKLTHLDSIFWPEDGYTKGDMVEYYVAVAKYILPHLRDRPLSLNRYPDGIYGNHFYQKNVMGKVPLWVKTVPVYTEKYKDTIEYILCPDLDHLLYIVNNLTSIEIHPWLSRIQSLMKPDFLLLDLDPHDLPFYELIKAALVTKDVLDEIKVTSFIKTSGKTGLHIVVPLGARYPVARVKMLGKVINGIVHERLVKTTSLERNPEKRPHKIYLDYQQNNWARTMAAPYCIRPRPHAPVSTPLAWAEVNDKLRPVDFNIKTVPLRLSGKGDLWGGVLDKGIDMSAVLERLRAFSKL